MSSQNASIKIGYKFKHLRTKGGKNLNKDFVVRGKNKHKVFYSYIKNNKSGDSVYDLEDKIYSFNLATISDSYYCEPICKTTITNDFKFPYNFIFSEMNEGKDLSLYASRNFCFLKEFGLSNSPVLITDFESRALTEMNKVISCPDISKITGVGESTLFAWTKLAREKRLVASKRHFYKLIPIILPFIAKELKVKLSDKTLSLFGLDNEEVSENETTVFTPILKTTPKVKTTEIVVKQKNKLSTPKVNEKYFIGNDYFEVKFVGKEGAVFLGSNEEYITFRDFENYMKDGRISLAFDENGSEVIRWKKENFSSLTKKFLSVKKDKEGNVFADGEEICKLINNDGFCGFGYKNKDGKNYLNKFLKITTEDEMTHIVFEK